MKQHIIKYQFVFVFIFLINMIFVSCKDDYVGDYMLTGNIESLIPENSWDIEHTSTSDGKYILFKPELNSNFEYWGLSIKQVDYLLDGTLYKTEFAHPYELMVDKDNLSEGNHTITAKILIVGEACNDVVLEKSKDFNVSLNGSVSEVYGDFYIDYNYVTQGDYLVVIPELLIERSSEGCEIDKVEYFWDGELVATGTTEPFGLNYYIDDEIGTTHDLNMIIYYHDDNNSSLTYNWMLSSYKIYDVTDGFISWNIKSRRNDYVNGETISLIAKLFKGADVDTNFEIEFYFDDELIGKSSSFPYTLDYKLSDLSIGSHKITAKSINKYDNYTSSSTENETIVIVK